MYARVIQQFYRMKWNRWEMRNRNKYYQHHLSSPIYFSRLSQSFPSSSVFLSCFFFSPKRRVSLPLSLSFTLPLLSFLFFLFRSLSPHLLSSISPPLFLPFYLSPSPYILLFHFLSSSMFLRCLAPSVCHLLLVGYEITKQYQLQHRKAPSKTHTPLGTQRDDVCV